MTEEQKELNELKDEWLVFKSRALSILILAVGAAFGYGVWVSNIQTTLNQLEKSDSAYTNRGDSFEKRLGTLEVNNGEIKTKLINIETTLQEIKVAIKGIH